MTLIEMSMDRYWIPALESGAKTATTRLEKRGDTGDTFEIDGHRYLITNVVCMSMYAAVHIFHFREGFEEWTDMRDTFLQYYPDLADGEQVYVHEFKEIPREFAAKDVVAQAEEVSDDVFDKMPREASR